METPPVDPNDAQPSDSTASLDAIYTIPKSKRFLNDPKRELGLLAGAAEARIRYVSIGRVKLTCPYYHDMVVKATRGWLMEQNRRDRSDALFGSIISGGYADMRFIMGIHGHTNDAAKNEVIMQAAERSFAKDFLARDIFHYLKNINAKPEVLLTLQHMTTDHPLQVEWMARYTPTTLSQLLRTFYIEIVMDDSKDAEEEAKRKQINEGVVQPELANQPLPAWNGKTPTLDDIANATSKDGF